MSENIAKLGRGFLVFDQRSVASGPTFAKVSQRGAIIRMCLKLRQRPVDFGWRAVGHGRFCHSANREARGSVGGAFQNARLSCTS